MISSEGFEFHVGRERRKGGTSRLLVRKCTLLKKNKNLPAFSFPSYHYNVISREIKKTGLTIVGAPRDRQRDATHEIGAALTMHDKSPRSSLDGGSRPLKAPEVYPTGRNSLDISKQNNILGEIWRQDTKTQKALADNGLSAFI